MLMYVYLFSCIFSLSLHCTEIKQVQAAQQEGKQKTVQQQKEEFIKKYDASYNPISYNCRPGIREGESKKAMPESQALISHQKIQEGLELDLVCMLAGKNIYLGVAAELSYINEKLENLLKNLGVRTVIFNNTTIHKYLLLIFTPEGQKNAYLFIKSVKIFPVNDYLNGHLLNYPDKDILAYYERNKGESYKKAFEEDKKNAQEWINANQHRLAEWVNSPENQKKYLIKFDVWANRS